MFINIPDYILGKENGRRYNLLFDGKMPKEVLPYRNNGNNKVWTLHVLGFA